MDTPSDQPERLISKLQGLTFQILEPSAFLQSSRSLTQTTIKEVKQTSGYQPAISLLTEPSLCLILIPADTALKLAHQVKQEYEKQMGRVRDRLPLNIGLVFCKRRTPVQTVLEAGRSNA